MTTIIGDADSNQISGTSAANRIFGLAGNMILSGHPGNDTLYGNQGDDALYGGRDDDILYGGQGNDILYGDRGNDILYGDRGNDTLIGGPGADTFVLSPVSTPSEIDTIIDFEPGIDAIGLLGHSFNNLSLIPVPQGTVIQDNLTNIPLALLLQVSPEQLTQDNFTPFVTPSPFPNGIASGDTTQTSTILWTRTTEPGAVTFEYATDPNFINIQQSQSVLATDSEIPVKLPISNLTPGTDYYYRVIAPDGRSEQGQFRTANPPGTSEGLRFGVSGDLQGALAPFVSLKNVPDRNLDFFVQMGDMVEADSKTPILPDVTQASTLEEFRLKQNEIYAQRLGLNTWSDLRANTTVYATWDDHEITNDFAGGATPADSPQKEDIFGDAETGFVNETPVFQSALQAFQEYLPLRDEFYGETGDPRTANKQKLYRYNIFGDDAATYVLDVRSFRDAPLPFVAEDAPLADIQQQLSDAFEPGRTMLGEVQLQEFKQDLLAAQNDGITWKFVMSTVPMQHFGIPVIGERWEGFAAERADLLNFIEENNIENVVFVTGDFHGNVVNNVSNQQGPGEPITPTGVFDIMVGPVAIQLTVPFLPAPFNETFAAPFGPATIGFTPADLLAEQGKSQAEYLALSDRSEKNQYVREVLDYRSATLLGYDPIGLEGSDIDANLLEGEYLAVHNYGWTEFEIAPITGVLTVTTYGVDPYREADIMADPAVVLGATPEIVSQFQVNPTTM